MRRNALAMCLILSLSTMTRGQEKGNYSVFAGGVFSAPLGSLADRFKPTQSLQVAFGQRVETDVLWEYVVESIQYSNPNVDRLYVRDLDLNVAAYGVGTQVLYMLGENSWTVQPFISGGATLYRFFEHRGAHATDSTNKIIVPSLDRNNWSFGFHAGGGVLVWLQERISLSAVARYHLLNAELWPALSLRLENVSGLQSFQGIFGARFEF